MQNSMDSQESQEGNSLNTQKVKNLLKLEDLLHNRYLSIELLHELISLYTCAIEHIDESQSPLRFYFLEKIQFALTRPEILKMLEDTNSPNDRGIADTLRETLRGTERQDVAKHINVEDRSRQVDQKSLSRYDGENEDQKRKRIDMQLQLMNEVQSNMLSIKKQYEIAQKNTKNQKIIIDSATKEQENRLNQRLERRRKMKKRKSSFCEDQQVIQMNKVQLLEAQKDIEKAVMRITARLTEKKPSKSSTEFHYLQNKEDNIQSVGRIKKRNRFSDDQD